MGLGWLGGRTRSSGKASVVVRHRILVVGGSLESSMSLLPREMLSELASLFRTHAWTAVWCGMSEGLAGAFVEELLDTRGAAEAVVVPGLEPKNIHPHASRVEVPDLHDRTRRLFQADGAVILPGGIGTLAELSQLVAMKQAGLWPSPIVVLDPGDWFGTVLQFLDGASRAGVSEPWSGFIKIAKTVDDARQALNAPARRIAPIRDPLLWVFTGTPSSLASNVGPGTGFPEQFYASLRRSERTLCRTAISENEKRALGWASKGDWWSAVGGSRGYVASEFSKPRLGLAALALAASLGGAGRAKIVRAWSSLADLRLPKLPSAAGQVPSTLMNVAALRFYLLFLTCERFDDLRDTVRVFVSVASAGRMGTDAARVLMSAASVWATRSDDNTKQAVELLVTEARSLLGGNESEDAYPEWRPGEPGFDLMVAVALEDPQKFEMASSVLTSIESNQWDSRVGFLAFLACSHHDVGLALNDELRHRVQDRLAALRALLPVPLSAAESDETPDSPELLLCWLALHSPSAAMVFARCRDLVDKRGQRASDFDSWFGSEMPAALKQATRRQLLYTAPYWASAAQLTKEERAAHPEAPGDLAAPKPEAPAWERGGIIQREVPWLARWWDGDDQALKDRLKSSSQTPSLCEAAAMLGIALFVRERDGFGGDWTAMREREASMRKRAASFVSNGPLGFLGPRVADAALYASGSDLDDLFEIAHDFLARCDRSAAQTFLLASLIAMTPNEWPKRDARVVIDKILAEAPDHSLPVSIGRRMVSSHTALDVLGNFIRAVEMPTVAGDIDFVSQIKSSYESRCERKRLADDAAQRHQRKRQAGIVDSRGAQGGVVRVYSSHEVCGECDTCYLSFGTMFMHDEDTHASLSEQPSSRSEWWEVESAAEECPKGAIVVESDG